MGSSIENDEMMLSIDRIKGITRTLKDCLEKEGVTSLGNIERRNGEEITLPDGNTIKIIVSPGVYHTTDYSIEYLDKKGRPLLRLEVNKGLGTYVINGAIFKTESKDTFPKNLEALFGRIENL